MIKDYTYKYMEGEKKRDLNFDLSFDDLESMMIAKLSVTHINDKPSSSIDYFDMMLHNIKVNDFLFLEAVADECNNYVIEKPESVVCIKCNKMVLVYLP